MSNSYPKPSAMGGTLIRKVIASFKENGFILPILEPILIATSGGADSIALAHLISRYGRKIILPEKITLLHFDHQWRKESGTIEKAAVAELSKQLKVGFQSIKLEKPEQDPEQNAEESARQKRISKYDQLAGESGATGSAKKFRYVFTAHHQDDVAETLFWRFIRGEFFEYQEGIRFKDHQVLRPFLKVKKEEIYEYIRAEKLRYFEDPTNQDTQRMRAYLRQEIFPKLEKKFPNFSERVARYASKTSSRVAASPDNLLEAILDTRLNRAQRNLIQKQVQETKLGTHVFLLGGWILERVSQGFLLKISEELRPKTPSKKT